MVSWRVLPESTLMMGSLNQMSFLRYWSPVNYRTLHNVRFLQTSCLLVSQSYLGSSNLDRISQDIALPPHLMVVGWKVLHVHFCSGFWAELWKTCHMLTTFFINAASVCHTQVLARKKRNLRKGILEVLGTIHILQNSSLAVSPFLAILLQCSLYVLDGSNLEKGT